MGGIVASVGNISNKELQFFTIKFSNLTVDFLSTFAQRYINNK